MTSSLPKFDVAVIGQGITGLSSLYHLQKAGIRRVALFSPINSASSWASAGMLSGGVADNFTRLSHARSVDFAKKYWDFGHKSYQSLVHFLDSNKVPWQQNTRLRMSTSPHEDQEMAEAHKQLQDAGFSVALTSSLKEWVLPKIKLIQHEGQTGGYVDPHQLKQSLLRASSAKSIEKRIAKVSVSKDCVELIDETGAKYNAEFVVLANHLGIADFLPDLKDALVSVEDQWLQIQLDTPVHQSLVGTSFSFNHGYVWGVFAAVDRVHIGGARFLRPMAGIGSHTAVLDDKVKSFLQDYLRDQLGVTSKFKLLSEWAGLDCRPCDELPIIGPMYGQHRLLLGVGYMGYGLTQGFYAGRVLADFVMKGKSELLPVELLPQRLRSLAEG
jgi:glycine/D-amino acid oxidase-like deaminating enzyme